VQTNVATSTQNQAFNALIFLYKRILEHPLEGVESVRSHRTQHIPVVLTREEVKQILPLFDSSDSLRYRFTDSGSGHNNKG